MSEELQQPGEEGAEDREEPGEVSEEQDEKQRIVTYEAADRGAVCCLGCQAWLMILGGIALGVWYFYERDLRQAVVGAIVLIGGIALRRYLATGRSRWEVSFDRDRCVVTLVTQERGTREMREIPFDDIKAIIVRDITRDVTSGEDVPHKLPVLELRSQEKVALDRRLSIKDPERAEEVAAEMRALVGLETEGESGSDIA